MAGGGGGIAVRGLPAIPLRPAGLLLRMRKKILALARLSQRKTERRRLKPKKGKL